MIEILLWTYIAVAVVLSGFFWAHETSFQSVFPAAQVLLYFALMIVWPVMLVMTWRFGDRIFSKGWRLPFTGVRYKWR